MKNRKKKKTVIIVAAAFVLLAAVGTAALRNHGRSTGAGKGTEVMTAPVTRQDISSRLSSSGVLKPRNSYQVSSLVEGEITSADFEVGDQVEKGQVLGHVTVSNGDTVYGTLDLVAVSNVERSELLYRLDQIKQFFSRAEVKLGLLVLLVVVLFLLLRWLLFGRRRRSRYGSGRGGYGGSHYRGRRRR